MGNIMRFLLIAVVVIVMLMLVEAVGQEAPLQVRDSTASVASCTSCAGPLAYKMPELPVDAYLSNPHEVVCFDCGTIHLFGEVRYRTASGNSIGMDPPLIVEFVWNKSKKTWEKVGRVGR